MHVNADGNISQYAAASEDVNEKYLKVIKLQLLQDLFSYHFFIIAVKGKG